MADPICPTFATNTFSVISGNSIPDRLTDSAKSGSANGYTNQYPCFSAGSFNNEWANGYLSQGKAPVFRNGLLSFGNTGLQS